MYKRKLKDLNLLDDFLFNALATYPRIGEEFCRVFLEIILGRKFGRLEVVAQKVYYGSDTDKHGARLDVYLEECEVGSDGIPTILDIEPEQKEFRNEVNSLPKRTRFYHAKIDARSLKAGETYQNLKNVIVIVITPFDPFGWSRMVYTIRNLCEEMPAMPYDDGARTLFLYTKGTEGNVSEQLRQLMKYMEETTGENAINENLQAIHKMVETVKQSEEVSLAYMKIMEREEMLISEGISQGKGIGEVQMLIRQILRKVQRGKKVEEIAEELEESVEVVRKISEAIEECREGASVEEIYEVFARQG